VESHMDQFDRDLCFYLSETSANPFVHRF
jgi:hypothetical protein